MSARAEARGSPVSGIGACSLRPAECQLESGHISQINSPVEVEIGEVVARDEGGAGAGEAGDKDFEVVEINVTIAIKITRTHATEVAG